MPPRARRPVGAAHSPRYRAFLNKLRQARHDTGLTQVEVAKALRRPQSFVSKCESGERRVDVTELEDFARLYRKRIDFFVTALRPR
jgi:transcriptional regulator with XRE-family HTH domain